MTYVVDTNILIDHLRARPEASQVMAAMLASGRRVTCSVLTRVELGRGARVEQAAGLAALESILEWVPVDHEIAELAAADAEEYGQSHGGDPVDYVTAATARRLGAELVTRDVRDFPMFAELQAPY